MAPSTASEPGPTNIVEMMQRLGIAPGESAAPRLGLSYETAFRRCEACPSKPACREWLDSMPRSLTSAPHFCPNAELLFELRSDQAGFNRAFSCERIAHIADLERLEGEIEEILLQKPIDDPMVVDLKRRKVHLRDEIEWLRHEAVAKRLAH